MRHRTKKWKLGLLVLLGMFFLGGCSINPNEQIQESLDSVPFEEQLAEDELEDIKTALAQQIEYFENKMTSQLTLGDLIYELKLLANKYQTPNTDELKDEMEVHFIDVGQGDCTLIINTDDTGKKYCMLIDAGGNATGTKVQAYLQKQAVDYLDILVVSHADEDHEGGADVVITKFDVGTVLMTDMEKDTYTHKDVLNALEYKNMSSIEPIAGDIYNLGDASVTVIGPVSEYEDTNNNSICIKVEKDNCSFLFCGDAEAESEQDLVNSGVDLTADVYHVNHHGSKSSSTEEFVNAVNPEHAVISVGENNEYWHPHGSTLNTLRTLGVEVYRTDEQGTIIATADGNTITWNTAPSDTWLAGEGPKK